VNEIRSTPLSEPLLFSPLPLRGITLRNRAVLSPMCQYQAVDGRMQDWHFAHHARFAAGGLAAAFVEATGVTREGRITYGCTGIWEDAQIPGLKRVVETYRAHGTVPGIQLAHAGRRASAVRPWDGAKPIEDKNGPEPAWETVAPSALPEREGYPVPRELKAAEIEDTIEAFAQAARRALAAGFDIAEVHGAHGYLTHSFFSPHSNKRSDAFGGSREKRMRFPLLVAEAVRAVWPQEKPVFYRASVTDNIEGGLPVEDSVALAIALKERGIDVIDCSAGGMSGSVSLGTSKIRPGYQVDLAAAIRRGADIPTMAVGAILEPRQAEAILQDGDADLVALARQMMAEPHWLYRAALELNLANPHAVLPRNYSFYLERRAAVLER
jgi:2,4-dienoyl-CoA reductase-like NADH-dependent reductase (Old Yellow Enzyme family)